MISNPPSLILPLTILTIGFPKVSNFLRVLLNLVIVLNIDSEFSSEKIKFKS